MKVRLRERCGRFSWSISAILDEKAGWKELLGDMIRAVAIVAREGGRLDFRIYGPSPGVVAELFGSKELPPGIRVMNKLPHADVPRMLQQADFSLILRRPTRLARAGFSTKFCESLANGTPVITNITGDMGEYMSDGAEGLICPGHRVDDFAESLRRALTLGASQRAAMRLAARDRALSSFDFRNHAERLGTFLTNL